MPLAARVRSGGILPLLSKQEGIFFDKIKFWTLVSRSLSHAALAVRYRSSYSNVLSVTRHFLLQLFSKI